ncbi:MAG: radical SAM protein [Ruminococcaceae bacterium]|nr:radical SAM protein [Oscillospiraceae bacterium]
MGRKHVNIPIFIPHMGCPNNCVFCNQHTISGHGEFELDRAKREIDEALSTISVDTPTEIAFFGGSFTGIDRALMVSLLELAESYVRSGRVSEIRLSTRPDYIDSEILSILSRYSVRTVELGLQSLDRDVLLASKRGHDAECARRACRAIKQAGFELIGQMMIGLPHSNAKKEIETAREICELGADGARVYPTVVFAETELADMMIRGAYVPLELEDAVERTKNVLDVFERAGVPCIRVGLCASENLRDASRAIAGANHEAIGEMAMSALYFDRICEELDRLGRDKKKGGGVKIFVSRGSVSKAVGQKRVNKIKICEKYGLEWVKVLEKNEIIGYNIIIENDV